jgi:hypothetical protein
VMGDSMSRQLYSTLIGHLRGQEVFLDPTTWHPARFTLRTESHGHCVRDALDLFWRPDPAIVEANLPPAPRATVAGEGAAGADTVVDWIMLPRFEPSWAVDNSLRLLQAAHATRNYTLVLLIVPSAWHVRETTEKQMAYNQSLWPIPSSFWAALNATSERMAPSGTRFAAVTMPLEHITCTKDDLWAATQHDECVIRGRCGIHGAAARQAKYTAMGTRPCLAHACCRRAMVAHRNEFAGLPARWLRIDFAAITNATRPPSLGWHYECQLDPPHSMGEHGVRECAESAMRLRFDACNGRYAKWFAATSAMPGILHHTQQGVGCQEVGNTALWRHMMDAHSSIFHRTAEWGVRLPS